MVRALHGFWKQRTRGSGMTTAPRRSENKTRSAQPTRTIPINVYIGFDSREAVAFSVLAHSIHRHATQPIQITPLMLSQLGNVYTRARHELQSTDFSFSRFLTPYLSGYSSWSIFMDCDMLMR